MLIGLYIISVILLGLSASIVLVALGLAFYEVYKIIKMDFDIGDISDIE